MPARRRCGVIAASRCRCLGPGAVGPGDGTAAPAVPGPLEPVPASPGEGADAPENAPNDDEILYHSV